MHRLFNLTFALAMMMAHGSAAHAGYEQGVEAAERGSEQGLGVEQNFDTARQWYRRAAARGFPLSLNALGILYVRGAGVPQDKTLAAALFLLAASSGNELALQNVQRVRADLDPAAFGQAQALAQQLSQPDKFLEELDHLTNSRPK